MFYVLKILIEIVKNAFNNQGEHILFSIELREKLLENNKNSGNIQGRLKYKTAVNLNCCMPVKVDEYASINMTVCHVRVSEWIHSLWLPECQGTPCSKQFS